MEKLLDYLLYALFGHNVTNVYKNTYTSAIGEVWTIIFEDHVYITIDTDDLNVIRSLYDKRSDLLCDEERSRYQKIFDSCR